MTQAQAIDILKTGAHVFLTGPPGSGKTHTLNQYLSYLRAHDVDVAITASTGIAATHIGGMTIHAWSGIGINKSLTPWDMEALLSREQVVKRVKRAKVLVIDEISMLDAAVLDTVDMALSVIRNDTSPFGGLQTILVGDFFQLPPVTRSGGEPRFAFESLIWERASPVVCYLHEQHRHQDPLLEQVLASIREHNTHFDALAILRKRLNVSLGVGVEPPELYTHNMDVDSLNQAKLLALASPARSIRMSSRGRKPLIEALKKNCLSPEVLVLKEGAVVMCTKNNFENGFVNGTIGTVVGFDGPHPHPVIKTAAGATLTIAPMEWQVEENGKSIAAISQIPLRLAWAITVHKSQGMTLDAAIIDLAKAFEYGQGYVALSRVRTLSGISLRGITERALSVHPRVLAHDEMFQSISDAAEHSFGALAPAELARMHANALRAMGGSPQAQSKAGKTRKPSTVQETVTLLREGKTLAEIASARGMVPATILGHIDMAYAAGHLTQSDIAFLYALGKITSADIAAIAEHFDLSESDRLAPVYEACGGKYTFDMLRIARSILRIQGKFNSTS
jgi:hypothetical protein